MSKKKKRVVFVVVLARVIAAVFAIRAAVREYRYQKMLAETFENLARNTEYVSNQVEMMYAGINAALASTDPIVQRDQLLLVDFCAGDVYDTVQYMGSYAVLYGNAHQDTVNLKDWASEYQIRAGMLRLQEFLRPYLTGERDPSDESFRQVLLRVQVDLEWMESVWDEAFSQADTMTDREFVRAFTDLFAENEPAWGRFFESLSQQN